MPKRKICVITGSRAEYGHLYPILKEIKHDPKLQLQLIATGMHMSSQFGLTCKNIEKDGFRITKKLHVLRFDDSEVGITKSVGLGCSLFADTFAELKPNIVVLLGDRYELLSAAIAAYIGRIAIAHIHGGETTAGAFDEGIRHSISKMATIHFPATEDYRRRIIQMGENPKRVFNFGSPGLDYLKQCAFLTKDELSKDLKFDLTGQVALATFHPVTLENNTAKTQIQILLKAIQDFDFKVVFTAANADTQGTRINKQLKKFCRANPKKYSFIENLGQRRYYSCLKNFDVMIGNSSSGIVEAPSFGLPVVNIGDRQKNRVRAANVIDSDLKSAHIKRSIEKALSKKFIHSLKGVKNPYVRFRDGRASYRIKEVLKKIELSEGLLKKDFFDLQFVA